MKGGNSTAGIFLLVACFLFAGEVRAAAYTLPAYHEVTGNLVTQTLIKSKSPYLFRGGCELNRLPAGQTLTVEAGVVVKFGRKESCGVSGSRGGEMNILGNLVVSGTAEEPVYFTSWFDDLVGGDTNGDGSTSVPRVGDWGSIKVGQSGSGSLLSMRHAVIQYAETNGLSLGRTVHTAQIDQVDFGFNGEYGLISRVPATVRESRFHDNSVGAIMTIADSGPHPQVDAIENWWGHDSGPTIASNPSGEGQQIFGNVLYDPWIGKTVPNQSPTLSFVSDEGYVDDGVVPNLHFGSTTTTFRITYTDAENSAPSFIRLIVNGTSYDMAQVGQAYEYTAPLGTFGKGVYTYYFETSDGETAVRFPESTELSFEVRNVPVILIPGILGTELKKRDELLWMDLGRMVLDRGDEFMDALELDENGEPIDEEVRVEDVVRGKNYLLGTYHYFDVLLSELSNNSFIENEDLFIFPYDWRLGNRVTSQKLKEKIDEILSQSGAEKVSIVAHSMGGLVTKQYILEHGEENIDAVIFLGTPHLGAPKAFKALVVGDTFGIPLVLNPLEMKKLGRNMPSVYQLLPSEHYFERFGGYFFNEVDTAANYTETFNYLTEQGVNSALLHDAEEFHTAALDEFQTHTIKTYNILGCNTPTVGRIEKRTGEYDLGLVAGDGTVPLNSALAVGVGQRYFVSDADHGKMPSQDNIRQLIRSILAGTIDNEHLPDNIFADVQPCHLKKGKLISVHSPVDLHVYDSSGLHVGTDEFGTIEMNIPGALYEDIDHNKFIFVPTDTEQQYRVRLDATATGTFRFRISSLEEGGTTARTVSYEKIDIVPESWGEMVITSTSTDEHLNFDANGSGTLVPIPTSSPRIAPQEEGEIPEGDGVITPPEEALPVRTNQGSVIVPSVSIPAVGYEPGGVGEKVEGMVPEDVDEPLELIPMVAGVKVAEEIRVTPTTVLVRSPPRRNTTRTQSDFQTSTLYTEEKQIDSGQKPSLLKYIFEKMHTWYVAGMEFVKKFLLRIVK